MKFQNTETSALDLTQPIRYWAEQTPDDLAIITNDTKLSYAELEDRVKRCATFLIDHKITDHEVCALDISDRLFFLVCWFALFRLQVTSTAFSPDSPDERKWAVVDKCSVGVVISEAGKNISSARIVKADMSRVLAHPYDPNRELKKGNSKHGMLISGSGTTGSPKMIAVGFEAIFASAPTESSIWGLRPGDVTFSAVHPWVSSVPLRVFNAFYQGGAFYVRNGNKLNIFDELEKAGANNIFAAVIHVEQMIQLATKLRRRLPGEPELTIYASVVTDGLVRRVKDNLTNRVKIVYGANEVGVVANLDLTFDARPSGSVGRVSEGAQIEIVNQQDDPVPTGGIGLVRARAPRLFSEYVGEPEETHRVLRNGWFYPGDVAKLDPDGHLILLGRSDQVMIYDGINIHPAEIENIISKHPAVADVAVMPMRHTIHQEVPICAVALLPGQQVSERDLRLFAYKRLAERTPARVLILDQIPRNDSGKIVRKELSEVLTRMLRGSTNS